MKLQEDILIEKLREVNKHSSAYSYINEVLSRAGIDNVRNAVIFRENDIYRIKAEMFDNDEIWEVIHE